MTLPRSLSQHLDTLTDGLDDGDDLVAILTVLTEDLARLTRSFLGLAVTLTLDGLPVTVSTVDAVDSTLIASSLLLPLDLMGEAHPGTTVVYYAATPGAFLDLARETRARYRLGPQVQLDQHLEPAAAVGLTGLDELTIVNQAIGILIGRGNTPEQAHRSLRRTAAHGERTLPAAARDIIDGLEP